MKNIIENDLKGIMGSLNMDEMSEDEKQQLKEDLKQEFNEIPGVEFESLSDDNDRNLKNDFKTTRTVLINNISRLEKLTTICVDNVIVQKDNIAMLQTTLGIISEQSKCLKLISELQAKLIQNQTTLNKSKGTGSKDSKIPESFKVM